MFIHLLIALLPCYVISMADLELTTIYRIKNDPLEKNQQGFPSEPLTMRTAKLCDENENIMLRRSWKCPGDPTCISCSQRTINRYNDLRIAFEGYIETLQFNFTVPFVTVMAVNNGQLDFFFNWAASLIKNNIGDPKAYSLVVPTDQAAYKRLVERGFYQVVNPDGWLSKLNTGTIKAGYNHEKANVGGHADINSVLLLTCNHILQTEDSLDVLMHDVDQVWVNKGPIQYLQDVSLRRDVLGMESPYDAAQGGINTGFVYFRNTHKTSIFLQSVVNVGGLKKNSDQVLINTMLRHRFFLTLSVHHLPNTIITRNGGRRGPKVTNETLVYHAVSLRKVQQLKDRGFWYLVP